VMPQSTTSPSTYKPSAGRNAGQPPAKEERVREATITQQQHVQIAFFSAPRLGRLNYGG
jgi:hypothetical protein